MSLSITIINSDGTTQSFDGLSIQSITLKSDSTVVTPPPVIVPVIPLTITSLPGSVSSPFTLKGTGPIGSTITITDIFTAPVVIPPVIVPPVIIPPSTITQPVGTWLNITPPTITGDPNFSVPGSNYGVENLQLDPVRPSDLYITADYQGVWKSIDYGQTWKKVNTGTNSVVLDAARPSLLMIDPSKRDPNTPPTLYTTDLYGAVPGLYKSIDGGLNFIKLTLPAFSDGLLNGQDPYALDIDPYDNKHLILSFHGTSELAESFDQGTTWKVITTMPVNVGTSLGIFFVDTGVATTRTNWVAISQWGNNTNGAWHTVDGGATWKQVGTFEHFHGADQLFNAGNGVAYISATGGVYKTVDGGATFTNINGGNGNGVIGTPTHLYTSFGWATNGTWDPQMASCLRSADTKWTAIPTPPGLTNGHKHGIYTSDGTHSYVITVDGNAGIWRFVES